ncbi:MAG: hypothetical protein IKL06_03855 [Lachnospiraceae bacterium]|nr:hypothetical protein [Lachnospiraceae bacterium]
MRKINVEKWEKYTPPGIEFTKQMTICLTGISAAFGWSWSFLVKYLTARGELFERTMTGLVVRDGAMMQDFWNLVHEDMDSLDGFLVFYLVMIGLMVYHYLYYYQGSKSIYLMQRLPDRWEIHRRNVTLPLVAIVLGVLTEIVVLLLYYAIYMMCTPAQCLPY